MESALDMLFEFEDEDSGFSSNKAASMSLNVGALQRRLELASRLPSWGRQLHADVMAEVACLRKQSPSLLPLQALATKLALRGWDVSVRVGLGGGPDCFKSLHHEFLVVRGSGEFCGMEFIVEPSLRQHFAIPHPTPEYAFALAAAPDVFVGGSCRLVSIVQLLCALMADSFERQGLPLPPWRREAAMISKWMPSPARMYDLKPVPGFGTSTAQPITAASADSVHQDLHLPASGSSPRQAYVIGPLPTGDCSLSSRRLPAPASITAAAACISSCTAGLEGCQLLVPHTSPLPLQPNLSRASSDKSSSAASEDDSTSPFVFLSSPRFELAAGRTAAAPMVAVTGFHITRACTSTTTTTTTIAASAAAAAGACRASASASAVTSAAAHPVACCGEPAGRFGQVSDFDCGSPTQERSLDTSSILASSGSNLCAADSALLMELHARARLAGQPCSGASSVVGVDQVACAVCGCKPGQVAEDLGGPAAAAGVTDADDELRGLMAAGEAEREDEDVVNGVFARVCGAGTGTGAPDPPSRAPRRSTQTGMLPCRCAATGLLTVQFLWAPEPAGATEAPPPSQQQQQQPCAAAAYEAQGGMTKCGMTRGSACGRVETKAPVHPDAPAIHLVRRGWPELEPSAVTAAGLAAWYLPTSASLQEPQRERGTQAGAEADRSWLPWTVPQQQQQRY